MNTISKMCIVNSEKILNSYFVVKSCVSLTSFIGLSCILGGCSIHPLPDDISRKNTVEIVDSIRCESYWAVHDEVQYRIDRSPRLKRAGIKPLDIVDNIHRIRVINPNLAKLFETYINTEIGYTFLFDIKEVNKNSKTLKFRLPIVGNTRNGQFDLGVSASLDKTRQGIRTFSMIDKFRDLIHLEKRCIRRPEDMRKKSMYPITGKIGMKEVIETFLSLSESRLQNIDPNAFSKDEQKNVNFFRDEIKFTTTISGQVDPKITLNAITNRFKLVEASANKTATRTDIHKVVVSMAFPDRLSRFSARNQILYEQCLQNLETRAAASNTTVLLDPNVCARGLGFRQ